MDVNNEEVQKQRRQEYKEYGEKKRDLIGLNVVTSEARRTLSHDKCYPNRSNDTAQRDSL
jgi:hypothetical protein